MFLARLLKAANRMKQLANRHKWRKDLQKNALAILSNGSVLPRSKEEIKILLAFCQRFRYFRNIKRRVRTCKFKPFTSSIPPCPQINSQMHTIYI